MILIGASGHAKVIIDALRQSGQSVEHLVDADPTVKTLLDYEVVHESAFDPSGKELIISIGYNRIRKLLAEKMNTEYGKAIHPTSIIAPEVEIAGGTVIMAAAVMNIHTRIGAHCIINTSASIDHDCDLDDYVHISPNATLCGNVKVGEGTHIGAGATVIPNLTIGKWVTVGAGAVVINDLPDYAVAVGNPARIIKYNDREI